MWTCPSQARTCLRTGLPTRRVLPPATSARALPQRSLQLAGPVLPAPACAWPPSFQHTVPEHWMPGSPTRCPSPPCDAAGHRLAGGRDGGEADRRRQGAAVRGGGRGQRRPHALPQLPALQARWAAQGATGGMPVCAGFGSQGRSGCLCLEHGQLASCFVAGRVHAPLWLSLKPSFIPRKLFLIMLVYPTPLL